MDCTPLRISAITIVAVAVRDKCECEYIAQIGGFCCYIDFLDAPYFLGSHLLATLSAKFHSKERSISKENISRDLSGYLWPSDFE